MSEISLSTKLKKMKEALKNKDKDTYFEILEEIKALHPKKIDKD